MQVVHVFVSPGRTEVLPGRRTFGQTGGGTGSATNENRKRYESQDQDRPAGEIEDHEGALRDVRAKPQPLGSTAGESRRGSDSEDDGTDAVGRQGKTTQRTPPGAKAAYRQIVRVNRSRSEGGPIRHLTRGREDDPNHRIAPERHVYAGAAVVGGQQARTEHARGTAVVRAGTVDSLLDGHVAVQPPAQDMIRPRTGERGQHQEGSKGGCQVFPVQNTSPSGSSSY